MKRQIICKSCQYKTKKRFPSDNPYPGEYLKFVEGTAKHPMICDDCGTPIIREEECCAFTIWADHGRQPYYEWEGEYLNLKEDKLC